MTAALLTAVPALAPIELTLREMRRRRGWEATYGLAPGLVLPAGALSWTPASELVTGERLDELLAAAGKRWRAAPHAAAGLAWKSYTYWLTLPSVIGWALARRVPLVDPEDVLVRYSLDEPFLTFGLRRVRVAVLPTDPLAESDAPGVTVVTSEAALLERFRTTIRDNHLDPLLAATRDRVRIGERALLGSLASGVAYGVLRGLPAGPVETRQNIDTLLSALDVADLVDLVPGPDGLAVHRRTCCLAFTLPQPKICSGCCIRSG